MGEALTEREAVQTAVENRPLTGLDEAPSPKEPEPRPSGRGQGSAVLAAAGAVVLFLVVAAVLFVVARYSLEYLPYTSQHSRPDILGDKLWFNGWFRWDGSWYEKIAQRGYYEAFPGEQSPAAYFPAYPFLMRIAGAIVHARVLGGIIVTLVSGAAVAALFSLWLREKVDARSRWTALLVLLLYPFAFYLCGAVYADALFIAAVLLTFLLIEHDLPIVAGLTGAVATAARPVGALLLIPLIIRIVERRGGIRKLRVTDAGVLFAATGIVFFSMLCWARYGSPLAFIQAQEGWHQAPGVPTWLKLYFVHDFRMFSHTTHDTLAYLSHPVMTIVALSLVPRVVRRFGWGYGSYVLVTVGLSAISTHNFFGMSRYVLAAFPCFAVAGELLSRRPVVRAAWLSTSGVLLLMATSLFARGYYLS